MPRPQIPLPRLAAALTALVAIAACDRPSAPSADQALYLRATDASLARNRDQAKDLYQQLLLLHPGSRYAPDAHVALAELRFNDGDFDAAFAAYAQALAYPAAKTWGYALYKQGWCQLNQHRPQLAMTIFERVIGLADDDRVPADQRGPLVDEARRALVKAYADAGEAGRPDGGIASTPEAAVEYCPRGGGGATTDLLDRLAEAYFDQERLPESQAIYRELITGQVDSPRLCAWQNSLVRIAMVIGSPQDQLAEVQRLGAVLARVERPDNLAPGDAEACRGHLRDTLKELTLSAHKRGQNAAAATERADLYRLADPLYRQYLTRFHDEQDAYTMTFYHAEVLWSLGRWDEAAQEYLRVMEMEPKGKFLLEAAYAYVLATKNALKLDDAPAPVSDGTSSPVPLSAAERKMLTAFDVYIAHVSDGAALLKIEYRKARIYYDHRDLATAAGLFRAIVDRHGGEDDELIAAAINSELDALNLLGRTAEVCTRVHALQGGPAAARDKDLAKTLQTIARGPMCKRAAP
jgi:tetratricopeptide (TPR) repeat protein